MPDKIEIRHYLTADGRDVIGDWLRRLRDVRAVARIHARIARLQAGNFGDCKSLMHGVHELRVDYGPGYRVYFARRGASVVLLLCAGDKARQAVDIQRAVGYLLDFERRSS